MQTIAANTGTTLTFTGQAGSALNLLEGALTAGFAGLTMDDVKQAITTALRGYGLPPSSVDVQEAGVAGSFGITLPATVIALTGTIVLRSTYDTTDDDLRANVAQAINDATGYAAAVRIDTVGKANDATDPQPSALPAWLSALMHELKTDATWIAVGGVGLVALVVIVVGYGPNIKKLASFQL